MCRTSVETKKGKYRHNHDDEAYQINDAVHDYSPGLSVSRPVLFRARRRRQKAKPRAVEIVPEENPAAEAGFPIHEGG